MTAVLANPVLLPAGVGLALTREYVIRPDALALSHGFSSVARSRGIGSRRIGPVLGRIRNSPDVSCVIERNPNQKNLSIIAHGQTTGNAARRASTAGQVAEQHWSFKG